MDNITMIEKMMPELYEFCEHNNISIGAMYDDITMNIYIIFNYDDGVNKYALKENMWDIYPDDLTKAQKCLIDKLKTKFNIKIDNEENDTIICQEIASEFPYSVSEVYDIYYKNNKSISETVFELYKKTVRGV